MTNPNDADPFAGGESAPSVSFKDVPIGTWRTTLVTEYATMVQSRDLATDQPAVWPDGNPKMCAVIKGTDENGEPCSIWAAKPSSRFAAIKAAQLAIAKDYRLKPGDALAERVTGEKPPTKRGHNPQKLYEAKIKVGTPPPVPPADDPWASSPAELQATASQAAGFGDEPPF